MAIYDEGTASLSADGTVTGSGTTWRQPLTLIRVGATMIFNTTPASIVTIAEIISDTEIRVFNDKGFTAPAGTQYSILAHDGITVQGLAQDVAETLRYYQSRETEVAAAVDAFNDFDGNAFQAKVNQVNTQSQQVANDAAQVSSDKADVSADKDSAAASAASALADRNAAEQSANDARDYADSINPSLLVSKSDLSSESGALLIGNFYTSAGEISARLYGIEDGVDNKIKLQELIDLSESLRVPVNFSGISDITFSGMLRVGRWFHWKGDSKYRCVIRPLTLTRTAMGAPAYITSNGSVYAWFARKDPAVSLNFARLQHMGFDGQYQAGYSTPADRLIRAFCWHFAGTSSVGRDIEAFDCYFKNCPHEAWEGYTHGGGQIDGIRYIQCVSEGTDPTLTAVGFNAFKCMNGNIDEPGAYGTYTIRNIVSKDNVATGHRTLTDLKRGCEHWVMSGNLTYDMNDCHHSTDGSRYGVFTADNIGKQTGRSNTTKNYLECQGENITIEGLRYSAAPSGQAGQGGLFVTDYKFPSETNYNQSRNIKVLSADVSAVNASAIRLVNTISCEVNNVTAVNCNGAAVSWEYVSGRTDGSTGLAEAPAYNVQGDISSVGCNTDLVMSTFQKNVSIKGEISNEHFSQRYHTGSITYTGGNKPYSVLNPVYENSDRFLRGVTSTAPEKTDSASWPLGTPYAFTLNDNNTASVQSLSVGTIKTPFNSRVFLQLYILRGTSSASSVIFRELDVNGLALVNTFRPTGSEGSWSERALIYAPTNAACAAVEILLAPAASAGSDSALTGTTSYADIRYSRTMI